MQRLDLAAVILACSALCVALAGPVLAGSSGAVSGALVLVEEQTLGADATVVTFSDLDGDEDGTYVLLGYFTNDSGSSSSLFLEPNGLATNQEYELCSVTEGTFAGATDTAGMLLTGINTAENSTFFAWFHAQKTSGANRGAYSFETRDFGAADSRFRGLESVWDETATNVTSIEIQSDVADGINTSSTFKLFKLR